MSWKDDCIKAIGNAGLFDTPGHRTRMKELVDCYGNHPFFSPGLCKCIYLSAWDDEHFAIMLETLTEMSLGHETNTVDMQINGDLMAMETSGGPYYIYMMSIAFLENQPFYLTDSVLNTVDPESQHIIESAFKAAEIIDAAVANEQ